MRRSDLNNHSASSSRPNSRSSSAAPEAAADLQARLAALYGAVPYVNIHEEAPFSRSTPRSFPIPETAERSYEFHLFSTTSAEALPPTIVLEAEKNGEGAGDGGFVVPERGVGYYTAAAAEGEQKRRYETTAVDGYTVAQWANRRNWGMEVPWRVKVIWQSRSERPRTQPLASIASSEDQEARKKRTKPNKKRRIFLRQKLKLKVVREEERKKKDAEKEEAEREKRTRRNREKKVKKKLKEKAKKLAGGAVTWESAGGAEKEGVAGEAVGNDLG